MIEKNITSIGIFEKHLNVSFDFVCNSLESLIWFINGSYAMHDVMRGQRGAVLMAGQCAVLFRSNKKK